MIKHRIVGFSVFATSSMMAASAAFAGPQFFPTSSPAGHWSVSTNVSPSTEGRFSSFRTTNFTQAVNITNMASRLDWIADVGTGSHGGIGNWTFFVFRQTFDLSGYDPSTANLTFRWAADDSGEIILTRGSWIPCFSLNGGAFVNYVGSTSANRIPTYSYSPWTSLSSGFVPGLNTIDFYVQGNGQTDGFALEVQSFTASVPTPGSAFLLALGGLTTLRRSRREVK
jgi:hypothetical protein